MNIYLKKLSLTNFKGIRSLVIIFHLQTFIFGRNASGKTTLMDAFLWLFFGKDSSDRKDFEIKTLDENNQPFHKLDHEVSAWIDVDGQTINIRRTFKEKWVKKRGSMEQEFAGHETVFYWNDVPMKESEYQAKIASLLNENIFKLITNTSYFNNLKWQDRRNVLIQIAGTISNADVLKALIKEHGAAKYEDLIFALNNKTVEEFKREIYAKKKKIKDDLLLIPSRIDEANRSLPEEKDYSVIEANIQQLKLDIDDIDSLLNNKSAAFKKHQENINILINKRQNINRLLMDIEFKEKDAVQDRKRQRESNLQDQRSKLRSKNDELARMRTDYNNNNVRKSSLETEQKTLREDWAKVDAEKLEFKEGLFACPACKRDFETNDIDAQKEQLTANFNTSKSRRLTDISEKGKKLADEIKTIEVTLGNLKANGETINAEITNLTTLIAELETEHTRLTSDDAAEVEKAIAANAIYQDHKQEVQNLTEEIDAPYTAEDNSGLQQRKRELQTQADGLKTELSSKGQREQQLRRIEELNQQEGKMAQELASLEGVEFSIEQFTKAKMDTLENRINGRFKIVKFKMFETQINGGEVEACTTLINGVPYSDANTAAKIQAGLDIINTLSDHYGIVAPVWVDNRESVTELPETNAQLINLIVSPAHKKLTISESALEMAEA